MLRMNRRSLWLLLGGVAGLWMLGGCAGTRIVKQKDIRPITFVQIADTQLGMSGNSPDDINAEVQNLRKAISQINALEPDFVVICGDLINFAGTEKHYEVLKKELSGLNAPWYAVPGNHDEGDGSDAKLIKLYRQYFGENYYVKDLPDCRLIGLDSCLWVGAVPDLAEKQFQWLERELDKIEQKNRRDPKPIVVAMHHPPYADAPDEVQAYFNIEPGYRVRLLTLCQKVQVKAILSGHTHRTLLHDWNGIELITAAPLSVVLGPPDPLGFRLFRLVGDRLEHQHVPLTP